VLFLVIISNYKNRPTNLHETKESDRNASIEHNYINIRSGGSKLYNYLIFNLNVYLFKNIRHHKCALCTRYLAFYFLLYLLKFLHTILIIYQRVTFIQL